MSTPSTRSSTSASTPTPRYPKPRRGEPWSITSGLPCPLFSELRFLVLATKMEQVEEVCACIDELGGTRVGTLGPVISGDELAEPDHGHDPDGLLGVDFIVTALKGRPRLERELGERVFEHTLIDPKYVLDVYALCTEAMRDISRGMPHLPNIEPYRIRLRKRAPSIEFMDGTQGSSVMSTTSSPKRFKVDSSSVTSSPYRLKVDSSSTNASPTRFKAARDEFNDWTMDDDDAKGKTKASDIVSFGKAKLGPDVQHVTVIPPKVDSSIDSTGGEERPSLPDMVPYPPDMRLKDIPRLAVERPSLLQCPNQDIIDAIKPIYLEREYDHPEQMNSNVLSYQRSMSVLKSVPRRLRSGKEARTIVDIGEKVANRIEEYLETGEVAESEAILASPRFKALQEFESIYTVGRTTAADLWKQGCRNLEDVRRRLCADLPLHPSPKETRERAKRRLGLSEQSMSRGEVVEDWLGMREELVSKIPRSEVEAIAACVAEHLAILRPGCQWTIGGGYRRGKKDSNDVDVLFRPPQDGQDIGLVKRLYRRLGALGIVTHVLAMSTRIINLPLHSHGGNFDNLDKAFVVLRLPPTPLPPGPNSSVSASTTASASALDPSDSTANLKWYKHRRVDLICSPPNRYAASILSWSGSTMFQRDLRRYCEDRGYKFRAGLIRVHDNAEVFFESERELFAFLGLRYVPPELRNADG